MSIDITQFSSSLPLAPIPEISRDNLFTLIHDMFGSGRATIVVQGAAGTGKTTLLAQFTRAFRDRTFSFFVGTTLLTSSPRYFLMDMCEQMGLALGRNTDSLEQLDTEEIKRLFYDFVRRIALLSRKTGQPYYFVVDGLERIDSEDEGKSLISLLPAESLAGIYTLLSSEPNRAFAFPHHRIPLIGFSLTETERYLMDLGLSVEDIQLIHKTSSGLPAYPAAIRRLLASGMKFSDLSSRLPSEIAGLFDLEWDRLKLQDEQALKILGVLAYAKEILTIPALREITGIGDEDLAKIVENIPFLRRMPNSEEVGFVSDAHKQYAADRLTELRDPIESCLIQYYSKNPYSTSSLLLLPSYLALGDQYEQLKALMSNDYLSQALRAGRDVAVLGRNLRLAAAQALKREDWTSLPRFALSSSLLRSLAMNPVGEDELNAVLALGDYASAFDIAYKALLPADRLHLLALVCNRRQQAALPVPENVLAEVQQMAETLEVTSLDDRALKIAAVLFDLMPEVAIRLVERSEGLAAGEKSLDVARATLAMRLQAEASDMVRARIADPALRDFARAHSPKTEKMSAEEVVFEADQIKQTSGKLFLLVSWCNSNRNNSNAKLVISKALEVITADATYAPSIRLLRQLAEPLVSVPTTDFEKLQERLEILKSTSIAAPVEEGIRFDLLMAILKSRQGKDLGMNSLLETYFSLDSIEELDTRCYCITRMRMSLSHLDPEDSLGLNGELREQLIVDFQKLLDGSADHFVAARRTLRELAKCDINQTIEFAGKLNTASRRDKALRSILWIYAGEPATKIDVGIVQRILALISEIERKELTLVLIIERLSSSGTLAEPSFAPLLLEIEQIADQHNKCFACAYAIKATTSSNNRSVAEKLFSTLKIALSNVDSESERVSLGFKLVTILAKGDLRLARELFEATLGQKTHSFLSDQVFSEVYVNCLRLALRAFSGLVTYDKNYASSREKLLDLINLVPSTHQQCRLLADLALRHILAKKREDFEIIVKDQLLPVFHNCPTSEEYRDTLIDISACLYEYDPSWFLEQVAQLSPSRADSALMTVMSYLVTRTLPDDPVEMESIKSEVDAKTARTICGVINVLHGDGSIYSAIEMLVDSLIRPDPRDSKREVTKKLIEREVLDIANRLEEIVRTKLPAASGIQHEGYVVVATAVINRLKAAAERRSRAALASWSGIATRARSIPNVADRVVVLTWTGVHMYRSDPLMAFTLIREAEELIPSIPNVIDRAERFYIVAKAWKDVDRKDGARMLLQTAMATLQSRSWDHSRDEINEQILKLAHSIDPEFASSLTPLMEDPVQEHEARISLSSFELQKNPQKVQTLVKKSDPDDYRKLLGQTAWKLLGSLNSGMSNARHPREIGHWIHASVDGKFEDVFPIMAWSIQNNLLQTKQPPVLLAAFDAVYDSVQLTRDLSHVLLGIRSQESPANALALPDDFLLFRAGKRSEVLLTIQDWISNNVREYLKIYDPYFSVADIGILKSVDSDVQVFIITSWKAQVGISPGDRNIDSLYKESWTGVSHHDPPWTQITVTGIKSGGDSPVHSRYLVTAGAGLNLGTSINGLGEKHTDMRILSSAEASKVEREFIDIELMPHLRIFKREKLIVYPFLL